MLIRGDDLIIGQPAHAWVSGQLARAWGNAAFPAPSPREPVCLAAEQHDVGWADADLAPPVGEDGRPRSFLAMPRELHVAIWSAAATRMLAQSRYAALLVSLHGTSLYQRVDPDAYPQPLADEIHSYLERQRELQERLATGLDPAEIDRNRRLIGAWDRFSLALCHGNPATLDDVPGAGGAVTIRVEPGGAAPAEQSGTSAARPTTRDDRAVPPNVATAHVAVDPWPFGADRVAVGCEAWLLPGTFATPTALAAALSDAPRRALRWELSPG